MTPPKVDLSLLEFAKHFKNEEVNLPKVFDIKNGKKVIEGEEFRERHEAVFYSGGCIVRTTKRGVKESRINASQGGRRDGGGHGGSRSGAYNPRRKEELSDRRKDSRGERSNKDYSRRRHESSTDRFRERQPRRRSRTRSRSPIKRKSQDYHRGDREHKKREDERRDGRGRQRGDERRSNLKH